MLALLVVLQLIVTAWWVFLQRAPNQTGTENYVFNGIYGLVFLVGGIGGLMQSMKLGGLRSTVGRAVTFISVGLVSYSIGQFIWMTYNLFLTQEVPYPSLADLFFITATPLFGIGFWHLLKMYRTFITHRLAVELTVAFAISSGIILFILGLPDVSPDIDVVARFLNVFYPFGDALLVSLAFVTFRTGGGMVDKSMIMFACGMLALAAADTLFTYRSAHDLYWNGDISDLLFSVAGFLLSWGVVLTLESFTKQDGTKK